MIADMHRGSEDTLQSTFHASQLTFFPFLSICRLNATTLPIHFHKQYPEDHLNAITRADFSRTAWMPATVVAKFDTKAMRGCASLAAQ